MVRRIGFTLALMAVVGLTALHAQTQPLTLEECVQIALDNNSNVITSEYNVKIADANVTSARSALLPTISSSFSSNERRIGPTEYLDRVPTGELDENGNVKYEVRRAVSDKVTVNSNSMNIRLNQTLFDFGQMYNSLKQSTANREAAKNSMAASVQNTVYSVHQAYYSLLKAQQLVEVYEESVKQNEEQLKRSKSMFEIGSVAQADVYRAESTLGQSKINLITQKNVVLEAEAQLNLHLGRPSDTAIAIEDLPDVLQPQDYTVDGVLQKAIAANPDLKRFKNNMAAANHGRKSAMSAYLPTLSGNVSYGRSNDEFQRIYTGFDKDWSLSFGISLNYNLFNGFRDMADVSRQTYNYRIAAENLESTRRDIKRQVVNALNSLEAYQEIAEINQSNLLASQEDLRLAQERYRVGAGTLLDVLTAQANLTQAKSTLVRAKYDMKIYEAQLASLMGEL